MTDGQRQEEDQANSELCSNYIVSSFATKEREKEFYNMPSYWLLLACVVMSCQVPGSQPGIASFAPTLVAQHAEGASEEDLKEILGTPYFELYAKVSLFCILLRFGLLFTCVHSTPFSSSSSKHMLG